MLFGAVLLAAAPVSRAECFSGPDHFWTVEVASHSFGLIDFMGVTQVLLGPLQFSVPLSAPSVGLLSGFLGMVFPLGLLLWRRRG